MVTGRGSDEALLREWLEAVREDIELPALGDAVREHPSPGLIISAAWRRKGYFEKSSGAIPADSPGLTHTLIFLPL
jgi:hypothetical protein